MRKIIFLFIAVLVGTFAMANSPVEKLDRKAIKEMTVEERLKRVQVLESRIDEITSVSYDMVDKDARKDLKGELNTIEKEMKMHQNGYGIYISSGALLVIIILLILL